VLLATRGRQTRKICGLRLFHADPWPTRACSQKPGEAGWLAQLLGGEISEGIGLVSNRLAVSRERLETGDWTWRSRLHLVQVHVLVLVLTFTCRLQCDDAASHGDTVPAVATSNTEICAMVETGCCIVRATRGAIRVG
jgi:hypothetical protein